LIDGRCGSISSFFFFFFLLLELHSGRFTHALSLWAVAAFAIIEKTVMIPRVPSAPVIGYLKDREK